MNVRGRSDSLLVGNVMSDAQDADRLMVDILNGNIPYFKDLMGLLVLKRFNQCVRKNIVI